MEYYCDYILLRRSLLNIVHPSSHCPSIDGYYSMRKMEKDPPQYGEDEEKCTIIVSNCIKVYETDKKQIDYLDKELKGFGVLVSVRTPPSRFLQGLCEIRFS